MLYQWLHGYIQPSNLSSALPIILTMGKNQQDGKITKVKLAKDDLAFLVEATKYTKLEIKEWYRSFRKECPAGVLRKADLHSMYLRILPKEDPAQIDPAMIGH